MVIKSNGYKIMAKSSRRLFNWIVFFVPVLVLLQHNPMHAYSEVSFIVFNGAYFQKSVNVSRWNTSK